MSNFKIITLAVFIFMMIFGIAIFALSKGSSSSGTELVVWGTISKNVFNSTYKNSSISKDRKIKVSYVEKDNSTFDSDLIEALADGVGPDVVILRDDNVYKNRNRIFTIPYQNYGARLFKDTFIEGSELFLDDEGVVSMPFIVDPIVMYWNRDLFTNNNIVETPKYWNEIDKLIEKITRKDSNANVLQSALALGEWKNINNAKEIISTLLLQSGTPITKRDRGRVVSVLNDQFDYSEIPSTGAIRFYTQFSNPTSPLYTWNRSLPSSLNFFLSGSLGIYIGFASEIFSIQQKNSNLNFDVTLIPQIKNSTKKVTFAHIYGLSILNQSNNKSSAFSLITSLVEPNSLKTLEVETNLPPVRRDLLKNKPTDAYRSVFYDSALISRFWIDPDSTKSTDTFRDMIESITSGKSRQSEALNRADDELSHQLR